MNKVEMKELYFNVFYELKTLVLFKLELIGQTSYFLMYL